MDDFLNCNTAEDFNRIALDTFRYQYRHLPVYHKFCNILGKTNPTHYSEIPFLPISFFKTHRLVSDEVTEEDLLLFKSSGTTKSSRSHHYIANPSYYEASFNDTFSKQIASPSDAIILALLPNYIEQGNSSLVYMVDNLINQSNHPLSGFYLQDLEALILAIAKAKKEKKKVILIGVSYALLDLAEKGIDCSELIIMETGGMKGRRKEMIKEEMYEILCKGLNVDSIYSEYGMTELLSQAYSKGDMYFTPPQWMKILIRDVNDPFQLLEEERTGGINVIDLANYYSCSFIATDDLGASRGGRFTVKGRFDLSDIRGCNLLVQ